MTMRALVKHPDEKGLRLESIPVPEPGPYEVLVKVYATGICGTDLHIYEWDDWARSTVPAPITVGHEFAGLIAGLGSGVSGFEIGEFVGAEGHVVCNKCRNCLAGRRHLCRDTKGIGVDLPGAFADFVIVPKSNIWRHTDGVDPDIATLFDPLGNAVHTALKFPVFGEDVLITGAGPIGIMAASVVNHAGARNTVITDVNPYRLDLAAKLGATRTVDRRTEELAEVQRELGMHEGFDVALEMSGNSAAYEDILANTIHGANVALLGIPGQPFPIDWSIVIFNMLNLKGIAGREMFDTWYKMSVLVETGLDLKPVITHRFEAEDYANAFDAAASDESGKVFIDWNPDAV